MSADALATFGEIASNIAGISEKIRGINEATQEQEVGVKQTSIAMTKMDEYSQRNNIVAIQVSAAARGIQSESNRLFRIMQASRVLVLGSEALRESTSRSSDIIDALIGDSDGTAASEAQLCRVEQPRSTTTTNHSSAPRSGLLERLKSKRGQGKVDSGANVSEREPESHDIADESTQVSADDDSFRAA